MAISTIATMHEREDVLETNASLPLIQQLTAAVSIAECCTKTPLEENDRLKALELAKHLVASLQTPDEVVLHYAWELGSQRMAIRLAIDTGIFRTLTSNHGSSMTAEELATSCSMEVALTIRILRVLSAIGFVTELGKHLYKANSLTEAIATPSLEAASKILHDNSAQVEMRMHDYFRAHGYKCPTDGSHCAFQWTFNTNLTYFQRIHENQETMQDFNIFMAGYRNTKRHWVDWYPVEAEVLEGSELTEGDDETLIVDIGGGKGHDLERFLARFPQAKGRLVLQDLSGTISSLDPLSPGITAMVHDIFTPQPVKEARVYYTHDILHDWPDDKCREILTSIKSAMRPKYSKILLNESVLPDTNCPAYWAAGDINMMAILAAKKRTRSDWIELIESAGLACVRIWNSPFLKDEEGIIEVTLAE